MYHQIKYCHAVILVILLQAGNISRAEAQNTSSDTLGIIEKIVEKVDTMVRMAVPDSVMQKWSVQPVDSMFFRNQRSKFKKEVYNLIIRSAPDTVKTPTTNTSLAAMDGMIIRRIEYDHVDIFAPSVEDTGYRPRSWFEKTVNVTHNDTREKILKRYMLLKPGDILDVFLAADNERILRDLPFIMDARFVPKSVPGTDSVDLILLTQDKFPIGIEADIEKTTLGLLGFSHQNILGFGHQFSATSFWDTRNTPHIGYRLTYGISNVNGTFISGRISYINRWNQQTYLVNFLRDFKVLKMRNAGGISFERTDLIRNIDVLDTLYERRSIRYLNTDMWGGRILVPFRYNKLQGKAGIFAAARLNLYDNITQPDIDEIYIDPFMDRKMLLFSAGILRQGFRKDNLIYTFGRTEDVPYGYLFEVTSGMAWSSNRNNPYLGFAASYGTFFRNKAYIYSLIHFGTFFNDGHSEKGAFNILLRYFSALHEHNRFKYRNFISFNYLYGIHRYPGEYITINNDAGISGLISKTMRGNDKIVLKMQSVFFSPYVLFGFHFAFFGGLDLGLIKRDYEDFFDSRLFSGLNIGIRVRNDQLVFNTFVIKFSFYPGKSREGTARYFIIDNEPGIRFNDFFPDKPDVINYQ